MNCQMKAGVRSLENSCKLSQPLEGDKSDLDWCGIKGARYGLARPELLV